MTRHWLDQKFPRLCGTIFIVTYGRTGSTLMQNILMTIPDCTIRGENHNILEMIWHAAMRGRQTRAGWGNVAGLASHPWFGADRLMAEKFAAGMISSFVDHVIAPPVSSRWFGFKEIRYDIFGERLGEVLDFLAFHFKNAHFVFCRRGLDDLSRSGWWKDWEFDRVAQLVTGLNRRFLAYHQTHPANSFIADYERFSVDPLAMADFFSTLGETPDRDKIARVLGKRLTH